MAKGKQRRGHYIRKVRNNRQSQPGESIEMIAKAHRLNGPEGLLDPHPELHFIAGVGQPKARFRRQRKTNKILMTFGHECSVILPEEKGVILCEQKFFRPAKNPAPEYGQYAA